MNNPLEWLKDANWYVRWTAAQALGESGDEEMIGVLVKVAEDAEEDFRVRGRAIKSIAEIGGQRAVEALLRFESTLPYSWREDIVGALGLVGDAAVDALAARLPKSNMPDMFIKALGETKSARAVEPLLYEASYAFERNTLRNNIIRALVRIGKPAIGPLVKALKKEAKNPPMAGFVADALGKFGDLAVAAIAELLNDDDREIRCWAMVALGNVRSKRAWDAICKVAYREKDRGVFKAGERALTKINKALKRKGESFSGIFK